MISKSSPKIACVHIITDMLYDFIDGTLACENGEYAVHQAIKYINSHSCQKVLYICDHHPAEHCSFKKNGGIWPSHCVKHTHGGSIHKAFTDEIAVRSNRPCKENKFYKGCNPDKEQYSGYEAVAESGITLKEAIDKAAKEFYGESAAKGTIFVTMSGIATEFCVRETVLDLLKGGYKVVLQKDSLAWVTKKAHIKTLKELKEKGVIFADV